MKFLVVVAFATIIAAVCADPIDLNVEQKAKVNLYAEECMKQENITEEEGMQFKNKNFTDPSENLKCFTNCFFEKTGTIKDGELQEAVVLEKLGGLIGEEKTKLIMDKCNAIKGENKCDTAFKLYECYENAKTELHV